MKEANVKINTKYSGSSVDDFLMKFIPLMS